MIECDHTRAICRDKFPVQDQYLGFLTGDHLDCIQAKRPAPAEQHAGYDLKDKGEWVSVIGIHKNNGWLYAIHYFTLKLVIFSPTFAHRIDMDLNY